MGPRSLSLGVPKLWGRRWLRLLVGVAVVASVVFAAEGDAVAVRVPATLADQRPVQVGPVEPGFPIDYLGVVWETTALSARGDLPSGPHGAVRFRYDGVWGPWLPLVEDDLQASGQWGSTLVPGGDADAYQLRGIPWGVISPRVVVLNTTDGPLVTVGYQPSGASALTNCLSRAEWGADESLRYTDGVEDWPATFEPVRVMTVHHTVTANNDSNPSATVRAIYYYHTITNGWGDIAYQYLIDEAGRVYEGRWSGEASVPCGSGGDGSDFGHNPAGWLVTGGHAYCYNRGNLGVALLGDFTSVQPKAAARAALEALLAENATRHGLDPLGTVFYEAPNDMAACANTPDADIKAIAAHTDWPDPAGNTACPGATFYPQLPSVRTNVALLMDPTPPTTTTTTAPTTTTTSTTSTTTTSTTTTSTTSTTSTTTTTLPIGDITLSVDTRIVRIIRYADLIWSGATSTKVDVWRGSSRIATTPNDGDYTDNTKSKTIGSATYKVCNRGTPVCSPWVTVTW